MIKTDAQRERTVVQIEGFRKALAKAEQETSSKRAGAIRNSYAGMIRQLEDERNEYDQLRSGKFVPPKIERLDQVAPFIVKLRIAKGVSQTELAKRLGLSKQVVSRYEEEDYQGASVVRLQEILDALGMKARVLLSA